MWKYAAFDRKCQRRQIFRKNCGPRGRSVDQNVMWSFVRSYSQKALRIRVAGYFTIGDRAPISLSRRLGITSGYFFGSPRKVAAERNDKGKQSNYQAALRYNKMQRMQVANISKPHRCEKTVANWDHFHSRKSQYRMSPALNRVHRQKINPQTKQ